MTRLLRAGLVVALVTSLVAAAGCGSDTKKSNDYVNAVNKVQTDFASSISKVQSSGASGGAEATFAKMKTAIDKLISDLKAIEPPGKVKDLHNQLVQELNKFDKAVADAADALKSQDPKKLLAAQTTFAQSATQVQTSMSTTIDSINSRLHGG